MMKNLSRDISGGLTAGIVALPLALAFGVQSGLGASAGLYGAIILGFLAAIFGGTKVQISGPTGPMTVVAASLISAAMIKAGGLEQAWPMIILTFALAGLFQIIFGVMKIGKYIKFIPYPVLSGFMSGIGCIIILLQLFPILGAEAPLKVMDVISQFPEAIKHLQYTPLLLALLTILMVYLLPRLHRKLPATLLALMMISIVNQLLPSPATMIGDIPAALPSLKLGALGALHFTDLALVLMPAITLAGLGSIDSLLTSVVADNMTRTRHNSNKELIGQGIGNMAAALFGGIPGAGATMRTVVNIKSGGQSRLSGVVHSLALLLIILGLAKYVSLIPLSVLAGILITVGISIIDWRALKNILSIPRSDAYVLITVLALTVLVDLLQAVGIGMVISSVIFMRKASEMVEKNTSLSQVERGDQEMAWEDEAPLSLDKWKQVYIKRFDGPIFFGVASRILERVNKIPKDARIIIFRMKRVPYIDISGMYALEEVVKEMQKMGIVVVFTMTQPQPLYLFRKNRFVPDIIPEAYLFPDIEACARWLKDTLGQMKNGKD